MAKIYKAEAPPEVALARQKADDVLTQAIVDRHTLVVDMLAVTSAAEAENATGVIGEIKAAQERWEIYWRPKINAAHTVHKMLCDAYSDLAKPLAALEVRVKGMVTRFVLEQKRQQEVAEREAERLADRARREAEAEAARLLRQGKVAEARELRQVVESIAAPVVVAEPIRLEGSTMRPGFRPVVFDLPALIRAVADGKVPIEALVPNEKFLKAQASARGKDLNWPGVRVEDTLTLAVSPARD